MANNVPQMLTNSKNDFQIIVHLIQELLVSKYCHHHLSIVSEQKTVASTPIDRDRCRYDESVFL